MWERSPCRDEMFEISITIIILINISPNTKSKINKMNMVIAAGGVVSALWQRTRACCLRRGGLFFFGGDYGKGVIFGVDIFCGDAGDIVKRHLFDFFGVIYVLVYIKAVKDVKAQG